MAIAFSKLTNGTQGAAALSFTTASITPAANALLLIQMNINATSASGDPTVTGLGLTWTQVARSTQPSADRRVYFFSAQCGATPGSGTLSASWTGSEQFVASWTVTQVTGHRTTNPIAQALTASGTVSGLGTPVAPTLAPPVNSADSRSLAVSYTRGTNLSIALKSTDWTQADRNTSLGTTVLGYDTVAWDAGPFAALGAASSNVQYCSIALEIAAIAISSASGADTGHVSDTGQVTLFKESGADTGHVSEGATSYTKSLTASDTGQVSDNGARAPYLYSGDEHAAATDGARYDSFIPAAETGAVTETAQYIVSYGDNQPMTVVDLAQPLFSLDTSNDTGHVHDSGQVISAFAGTQTGQLVDAGQLTASSMLASEHITATDEGSYGGYGVTGADTATVIDTGQLPTPATGTDTGQLSDAATLRTYITVSEAATLTPAAGYTVPAATGTDTATITEFGGIADLGPHRFSDTEIAHISDAGSLVASAGNTGTDTGQISETGTLATSIQADDTGQVVEAGTVFDQLAAADSASVTDDASVWVIAGPGGFYGPESARLVDDATLFSLDTGDDAAILVDLAGRPGSYLRHLRVRMGVAALAVEVGSARLAVVLATRARLDVRADKPSVASAARTGTVTVTSEIP